VTVRPGNRSATISWGASALGSSYTVQRSTNEQGPFVPISNPAQFRSPTTYVDPGLANGTTYFYRVVAGNSFGQSAPSEVASGTPGFHAIAISSATQRTDDLAVLRDGTVWEWGAKPLTQASDVPVQVEGLFDIVAVSSGGAHHLALGSDGRVWAWGDNFAGQLGDGAASPMDSAVPIPVINITDAIAISAGASFSMALRSDGTVMVWGDNGVGEFGLGTSTPVNSSTPLQVPGVSGIIAIAAGRWHALALRADGLVMAWGNNLNGQLGNGSIPVAPFTIFAPDVVSSLTGVIAIAAGTDHNLAVRDDGSVWAWGSNGSGQLGLGSSGAAVPSASRTKTVIDIVAVSASQSHSLAVRKDGTMWAWGSNSNGQMGNGASGGPPVSTPVQVQGVSGGLAVAAGQLNSVGLGDDGTVWTWGDNANGALGNGTGLSSILPVQMTNVTGAIGISGGFNYSACVRSSGIVSGWGGNNVAQLGNGATSPPTAVAVQATGVSTATSIAAGGGHVLALLTGGGVVAWGANGSGVIGNGTSGTTVVSAVPASTPSNITAVAAGFNLSLAIRGNGDLYAWGENSSGTIGLGSTSVLPVTSPTLVPNLAGVFSAAAGGHFVLAAFGASGAVCAWGDNSNGQLGLGPGALSPTTSATQIPGLTGVMAVAAGSDHALALKGGTVWAWGAGTDGQLGNGGFSDSNVPVPVLGLTGVIAIAGGLKHSLALKNDGTVWAWGDNSLGQLGNPVDGKSAVPVQVLTLAGATAIAAGFEHSMAILQNQTVWCWGRNDTNQLGAPYLTQSNVPVTVTR
jgi:alpha-tubulin suppressor-like RCC1 family protein